MDRVRSVGPPQRSLRRGRHFAPTMQGHDAHAERARDLALQLSLSRQIICFRELGDNFRLRVLSLFRHQRFLGRFFHFSLCFDASSIMQYHTSVAYTTKVWLLRHTGTVLAPLAEPCCAI